MPPPRKARGIVDDRLARFEGRDPGQIKPDDIVDLMVMTWPGDRSSNHPAEYQPYAVKVISVKGNALRVVDRGGIVHDVDRKEIRD